MTQRGGTEAEGAHPVQDRGDGLASPLQINLADVHGQVYKNVMKRRELEEALRKVGWRFLRHGAKHDVWTDGERQEPVPRHTEINEKLARVILRRASRKG